ncbi:conserved hypothetical protein [Ricinus communis]|uniref:Uncharacterized protein n=1 Tax=Ricinus communis TaxID=3988 RepID=B9TJF5_RICCO|nr:conserved hypothetical protein [Ricinus communis]
MPAGVLKGICQVGEGFSVNDCNNKLIGARYFKVPSQTCTGLNSCRRAIPSPARKAMAATATTRPARPAATRT